MSVWKKITDAYKLIFKYIGDTFSGWKWSRAVPEIAGALNDTVKDLCWRQPGRELLTILAIACVLPAGSVLYPVYRLRLYRARIGTCTAPTEPLLTDERLALFKSTLKSAPGTAMRACGTALRAVPRLGLQGGGLAVTALSVSVATEATYQSMRNPFRPDYALLKACHDTPRGHNRPVACEPLLAHQRETFNHLSRFAGGLIVGVPAGMGMIAVGRRRKAASAPKKAAGKT